MKNEFGKFIETLRGKISLRDVAEKSGLSHAYIRDLELGINRKTKSPIKPSPEVLRNLAKAYNHPYEDLMEKAGYLLEKDTQEVFYKEYPLLRKLLENESNEMKSIFIYNRNPRYMVNHVLYYLLDYIREYRDILNKSLELLKLIGYDEGSSNDIIQQIKSNDYEKGVRMGGIEENFNKFKTLYYLVKEGSEMSEIELAEVLKNKLELFYYTPELTDNNRKILIKYNSLSENKKKMLEGMIDLLDSSND